MAESVIPTVTLRIMRKDGVDVLEQMFWPCRGGAAIWIPVPIVTDDAAAIRAGKGVEQTGAGKFSGPLSDDRTGNARPAAASMVRESPDPSQPTISAGKGVE